MEYSRQILILLCMLWAQAISSSLSMAEEIEDSSVFIRIEREMSPLERRAMGIDGLSVEQLEALNQWLRKRFDRGQENTTIEVRAEVREQVLEAARMADAAEREAEIERRVAIEVEAAKQRIGVTRSESTVSEPVKAKIQGSFSGWSGNTVFALDNGQVWKQRAGNVYRHKGSDYKVELKRNFFGGWEMTMISSGKTVLVTRVK